MVGDKTVIAGSGAGSGNSIATEVWRPDLDERFSLYPDDAEDVLRRLLAPEELPPDEDELPEDEDS